jgi:tetratricopeptide (TPR) repeat protein
VQERLRRAEVEKAASEARAEEARATARAEQRAAWAERRRRRLTAALALAALLLVVAGGAWAWQRREQQEGDRARRREAGQKAELALERGRSLLEEGWRIHDLARLQQAVAEAERAVDVAIGAEEGERRRAAALLAEATRRLEQARRTRALIVALLDVITPREIRAERAGRDGRSAAQTGPSVEEQFQTAFQRWGLGVDAAEGEAVARLRELPGPVRAEVLAGLDSWIAYRRQERSGARDWSRLRRLADGADDSAGSRQLRALLCEGQPLNARAAAALLGSLAGPAAPWAGLAEPGRERRGRLAELRARAVKERWPVQSELLLARASEQAGDVAGAEAVLREALTRRPDQVALLAALGRLLEAPGRPRLGEAIECFRAARALQPRLGVSLAMTLAKAGRGAEGEAVVRDLLRRQPDHPQLLFHLGVTLDEQKKLTQGARAYRTALQIRSDFPEAYYNLGVNLYERKDRAGAVRAYRKAIELRHNYPEAHLNLGRILAEQQQLGEAVKALRTSIKLRPDHPMAHNNLGAALTQLKLPGAVQALRKAIELRPDYAMAYSNLGNALCEQKEFDAAVQAYRKAIEIDPDLDGAYVNLGTALHDQGKLGEAVQAYHKALQIRPDSPEAYYNLGNTLAEQKDLDAAVQAYRKAIALREDYLQAYGNLGAALGRQGKLGEAVEVFRKAIRIQPDDPELYYGLATALYKQQQLGEAVKALRTAIKLRDDYPEAHCNLGHALRDQGHFREALASFRRGHQLGSRRPGWRYPSAAWVADCAHLAELDDKLAAVLSRKRKPAGPAEALELAALCRHPARRLYAAAAGLYATGFAMDRKRADDLWGSHRYGAALCAILAAAGEGTDAPGPGDKERARLRSRALDWLRADLRLCEKLAQADQPEGRAMVQRVLWAWQNNPSLASVRNKEGLGMLADVERVAWERLWADAETLRTRVSEPR